MDRVVRIFKTFDEADAADKQAREEMTPQERVEIFLALQQRGAPDAAEPRLEPVCRVLKLAES